MPSASPVSKLLGAFVAIRRPMAVAAAVAAGLALAGCAGDTGTRDKLDRLLVDEARQAEQAHDYETAIRRYAVLYDRKPDDTALTQGLARTLRAAGRFEDARTVLAEALARQGPQPRLLLERGKDEIALGRPELAVPTLVAVIAGAPGDWEAAATLAIAYDRLGRYDEAAVQYRVATGLNPENPDVLNNYALSRALAGRIDEALALLRRAVALPSAGSRTRENLAFLESLQPKPAPVPRPLVAGSRPPATARATAKASPAPAVPVPARKPD